MNDRSLLLGRTPLGTRMVLAEIRPLLEPMLRQLAPNAAAGLLDTLQQPGPDAAARAWVGLDRLDGQLAALPGDVEAPLDRLSLSLWSARVRADVLIEQSAANRPLMQAVLGLRLAEIEALAGAELRTLGVYQAAITHAARILGLVELRRGLLRCLGRATPDVWTDDLEPLRGALAGVGPTLQPNHVMPLRTVEDYRWYLRWSGLDPQHFVLRTVRNVPCRTLCAALSIPPDVAVPVSALATLRAYVLPERLERVDRALSQGLGGSVQLLRPTPALPEPTLAESTPPAPGGSAHPRSTSEHPPAPKPAAPTPKPAAPTPPAAKPAAAKPAAPTPPAPVTLLIETRHGQTRSWREPIQAESITIGRGAASMIRIDAPGLADLHLVLNLEPDGRYTALDLAGDGSTRINGRPSQNHTLTVGDAIQVGTTFLTWSLGPLPGRSGGPGDGWNEELALALLRREHQRHGPRSTWVRGTIPKSKADNARKAMGVAEDEIPWLVHDATLFGSASEGVVVSASGLYWKNTLEEAQHVRWRSLQGDDDVEQRVGPGSTDQRIRLVLGKGALQLTVIGAKDRLFLISALRLLIAAWREAHPGA